MSDSDLFSSDDDVIPNTPQKPKNNSKLTARKKEQFKEVCEQKATSSSVRILHEIPFNSNLTPKTSNVISRNLQWKKPYLFFDIQEILNFNRKNFPLYNKIRTLGIFKKEDRKQFTVNFNNTKLFLNLSSLNKDFPEVEDIIEIFGSVQIQRIPNVLVEAPLFTVQFWRKRKGSIREYIKIMKQVQTYAPDECKQMINDDVENSRNEFSINFEEIDESLICRVADNIQNIKM